MGKYWSHDQETKDRIAAQLRGRKRSGETRKKMSESHLGLRPTDETREKMRAAQREAQNRPGVAAKKGGPNTGRSAGRPRVRYPDPNALRDLASGQRAAGSDPRPTSDGKWTTDSGPGAVDDA